MANGRTPLTAANLQDAFGNPLASGSLQIITTNGDDVPEHAVSGQALVTGSGAQPAGGAIMLSDDAPSYIAITNGALPANTTIADTRATAPQNISYRMTVCAADGTPIYVFKGVQSPQDGSAINLDTYQPPVPAQALTYVGPRGPQGPSGVLTGTVPQLVIDGSGVTEIPLPDDNSLSAASANLDEAGYSAFYDDQDGTRRMAKAEVWNALDVSKAQVSLPGGATEVNDPESADGAVGIHRDAAGYTTSYIDEQGVTQVAALNVWHDVAIGGHLTVTPTPRTNFDLNVVLVTGQSLAEGFFATVTPNGADVLSTTQPFANVCLNPGPRGGRINSGSDGSGYNNGLINPSTLTSLKPLVENADQVYNDTDTTAQAGETVASGLANQGAYLLMQQGIRAKFALAVSAMGGAPYVDIAKGTNVYANALTMVAAIKSLAGTGKTVGVQAIVLIHGENDEAISNPNYEANILQLLTDYNTDLKALTPQTQDIPMLIWLPSTWATGAGSYRAPFILPQMEKLAKDYPSKFFTVGSQYPFTHAPQDGVHLIAASEQWGGEKVGEVLATLMAGGSWTGVRFASGVIQGKTIVANFAAQHGPLVLDTSGAQVTDPGTSIEAGAMYGFKFKDGTGSPPAITAISVIPGTLSLRIDLASVPTGTAPVLEAAWTGTPGASGGPTTGPRCLLRDSDPTPSLNGHPNLYNWCQPFSAALRS